MTRTENQRNDSAPQAGLHPAEAGCCASDGSSAVAADARRPRNVGLWATVGSLLSAILASACCWLPLLLVAFGASAAGVGAVFDGYRTYLLGAAAVLLSVGFYFHYVRKEKCEPGSACAVPNPKARRLNRTMFWVAALFIGTFAFFPNYVGYLLGGTSSGDMTAASEEGEQITLALEGFTCEGCAANVRGALERVEGVRSVEVDYASRRAWVFPRTPALSRDPAPLLRAVEQAGYQARVVDSEVDAGPHVRRVAIDGMTCQGCAAHIRASLEGVAGVEAVDVSYAERLAKIRIKTGVEVPDELLLDAVAKAGYRGAIENDATGDRR